MMRFIIYLVALIALVNCGGGGGDGSPNPGNSPLPGDVLNGVFVDSPVTGLQFSTETQAGVTDSDGKFAYISKELVSFYIGSVYLGSAIGAPILSPLSLVPNTNNPTNPTVTNIVRLLMTLDDDNNPNNGIQITNEAIAAGEVLTINFAVAPAGFESDPNVQSLIDGASGQSNTQLVGITVAQEHLATSISSWGTLTWGTGVWKPAN